MARITSKRTADRRGVAAEPDPLLIGEDLDARDVQVLEGAAASARKARAPVTPFREERQPCAMNSTLESGQLDHHNGGTQVRDDSRDIDRLHVENELLRQRVLEFEEMLDKNAKTIEFLSVQNKDQERILEEKSDVIRELHVKLQNQQEQPPRPAAAIPREDELLALSEQLEQERRQLQEDEETLMQQMREMEIQMSRERAELARQRTELQRLHNEIRHELETAARESQLRDRLLPLQRRHQEMGHCKSGPAPRETGSEPANPQNLPVRRESSGIFRRLFG